ncbi:GNAT family N-acetyltransferase [Shewanella sp. 10N.7]|uniref:GNAT family N-acetyltransferase n=1 Tax=Shewanella sp. 10N.7 TaxID=2885093 RepID=UPI001E48F41B|nr:GNAT family N-acetyltransferase [Shewanella sp. 10N.7]MCC4831661.1 GNAT family N-acetyltransferase [Shewanella sp. 10N.7]
MINVRRFTTSDIKPLWQLKLNTIHNVISQHYSLAEVTAWAPHEYNESAWVQRVTKINPFVAEVNGVIAGFADLQDDGYIDHFYCSADFQKQGVGDALMQAIFNKAAKLTLNSLYAEVSITAKPFFSRYGFVEEEAQSVAVRGQKINNFVMRKLLG